ncbi:unnamed protein product [Cuscuta europaea]|uniref:Uncharacterized protein n=1 Tax=Cuscuta europaea TaxID=41803 RepID=A0A9P0ZXN4_CUSEU|nr:unnamed protein product [Cuscuta europaea]
MLVFPRRTTYSSFRIFGVVLLWNATVHSWSFFGAFLHKPENVLVEEEEDDDSERFFDRSHGRGPPAMTAQSKTMLTQRHHRITNEMPRRHHSQGIAVINNICRRGIDVEGNGVPDLALHRRSRCVKQRKEKTMRRQIIEKKTRRRS